MEDIKPVVQLHSEAERHRLKAAEIGNDISFVDRSVVEAVAKSVRVMRQQGLLDDDNPCIYRASD